MPALPNVKWSVVDFGGASASSAAAGPLATRLQPGGGTHGALELATASASATVVAVMEPPPLLSCSRLARSRILLLPLLPSRQRGGAADDQSCSERW